VKKPALSLGRPGGNRAATVDPTKQALTVEAHGTPDTDTRDSAITGEGVDLRGSHSKEARRFGGRQHWRKWAIAFETRIGAARVPLVGWMVVMCRGELHCVSLRRLSGGCSARGENKSHPALCRWPTVDWRDLGRNRNSSDVELLPVSPYARGATVGATRAPCCTLALLRAVAVYRGAVRASTMHLP
jgi:hypothetical protein